MAKKDSLAKKAADNTSKGAYNAMLQELFQDMYAKRWNIYKMNFIRGLVFGFGSALGATMLIFLLAWLLSLFDTLPIIGDFVESARNSLDAQPK